MSLFFGRPDVARRLEEGLEVGDGARRSSDGPQLGDGSRVGGATRPLGDGARVGGATRRLVLKAGVAAGVGLLGVRGSLGFGMANHSLALVRKPIPSTREMLPAVGLGTNNFDVGDSADIATR